MLRKIKLSNLKTSSIMPKKVAKDWISLSTGARACQSYLIWTHEGVVRALEVVAAAMVARAEWSMARRVTGAMDEGAVRAGHALARRQTRELAHQKVASKVT